MLIVDLCFLRESNYCLLWCVYYHSFHLFWNDTEGFARFMTMFAFHPAIRFFQIEIVIDGAAYRALNIVFFHVRLQSELIQDLSAPLLLRLE